MIREDLYLELPNVNSALSEGEDSRRPVYLRFARSHCGDIASHRHPAYPDPCHFSRIIFQLRSQRKGYSDNGRLYIYICDILSKL